MPAVVERRDGKWRVVDGDTGRIETGPAGNPVDGGGHEDRKSAEDQAAAINIAQAREGETPG